VQDFTPLQQAAEVVGARVAAVHELAVIGAVPVVVDFYLYDCKRYSCLGLHGLSLPQRLPNGSGPELRSF
jgi:hypothetical protein